MGILLKFAFLISCLFAGWEVTPITVAECLVYPLEVNGDSVSPSLQKSLGFFYSLSLSSTFSEELNEYCTELLRIFGQRYEAFAVCLVSYARPVKICQNCYPAFNNLGEIYKNISDEVSVECSCFWRNVRFHPLGHMDICLVIMCGL